jgi:hypothetical protein
MRQAKENAEKDLVITADRLGVAALQKPGTGRPLLASAQSCCQNVTGK